MSHGPRATPGGVRRTVPASDRRDRVRDGPAGRPDRSSPRV